jgi:hypothetical protein
VKNYIVARVVVLAVLGGIGCGGEKSPSEKCEDLVSLSYDRCIDQLNEQSCRVLFPTDPDTGDQALELPAECNGVLLTQSAGGRDHVVRTNISPSSPLGDMALRARAVLPSELD